MTSFQLLTIENWDSILFETLRSSVNKFVTILYFISWIFVGNFSLLNFLLAILLDGFTSDKAELDMMEAEGYEEKLEMKKKNAN